MLGELGGMGMVSTTSYDWGTAAASSLIMAAQLTGRRQVLVPRTTGPTRLREIRTICGPTLTLRPLDYEPETGWLDLGSPLEGPFRAGAALFPGGPGTYVFDWVNFEHISYGLRAESHDFAGTSQTIWAIVAGVYLALMGPAGMRELGETIMQRRAYAAARLAQLDGVVAPPLNGACFKEFVVTFDGCPRTLAEINAGL